MEKKVIIPQIDIDRLEKARVELCSLPIHILADLSSVTQAIWHVTHRKYEKIVKGK